MLTVQGQPGVLSYAEIEALITTYGLNTVHDEEAMVEYMAWGQNKQWVSYDDQQTLQSKVDYGNSQGYALIADYHTFR
jgi:chitinase